MATVVDLAGVVVFLAEGAAEPPQPLAANVKNKQVIKAKNFFGTITHPFPFCLHCLLVILIIIIKA